ncbi:MAG: CPBP family intramembrane metalloprotease [Candidatus Marsarchaeota archaeon]|nr:CPBP family intramembrane metalloprotease [Candidatus Marsarchaeota archaeon]
MMTVSLESIVNVWWILGFALWTFFSFYVVRKYEWFHPTDPPEFFPFSARQFFVIGAALFFAAAVYFASFLLAHTLTSALRASPVGGILSSYKDWVALDQIIGIAVGCGGLTLLVSLLPADLVAIVTGTSSGIRKWARGFGYGVLFFPLVTITCWIVSLVSTVISPGEHPPQLAVDLVAGIVGTSWLFWTMVGFIVFLVPYVEEMLFRGFLQGFLGGLVHPLLSTLLTAAAFAFFHYSPLQKASNLEIIVALFVFSLLASRLRLKENSVIASVGMHAGFNATSMVVFFLQGPS